MGPAGVYMAVPCLFPDSVPKAAFTFGIKQKVQRMLVEFYYLTVMSLLYSKLEGIKRRRSSVVVLIFPWQKCERDTNPQFHHKQNMGNFRIFNFYGLGRIFLWMY